jgi:hypothetical protein
MALWGLSVSPLNDMIDVKEQTAVVRVTANVQNHGKTGTTATISGTLNDAKGAVVCQIHMATGVTVPPNAVVPFTQLCNLSVVQLWSTSRPYL